MHDTFRSSIYCSVALFFICLPVSVFPQANTNKIRWDNTEYEALFAKLFPMFTDKFDTRDDEFAIDIRIRPSFGPTKQVSLKLKRSGGLEILLYTTKSDEPVSHQARRILDDNPIATVEQVANAIGTRVQEIDGSPALRNRVRKFFATFRIRPENRVSLDGVGYDITYVDSGKRLTFSIDGSEVAEQGESPLVGWSRGFLADVEASARRRRD